MAGQVGTGPIPSNRDTVPGTRDALMMKPTAKNCNEERTASYAVEAGALALYDEFQSLVQGRRADVGTWIHAVAPKTGTIDQQLAILDTFKSWLDSFRPLPPGVAADLQTFYTVNLTYHSNALEGNTLTQSETELVLSHGITIGGKSLVEHLEVIGHRDAMAYMEVLARNEVAIGEREIKELHSLIMLPIAPTSASVEAGVYRTLDVRAAGTGYVYASHYRVRELMEGFASWLESEVAQSLHPVAFASEAHYRLVTIHPFRDGNGRTARLLMNLCLLRAGYPITVIDNAQRALYISALAWAQGHGDDFGRLTLLVSEACRRSFLEYLRLLATAGESRGLGARFYGDLLASKGRLDATGEIS